ncbi:hypothetical protein CSE16_08725 [Solibacillus sp. R5-41]|uniref:hypothetical protein n=1 Tax=Solibacillus sp. R5-41 TaxID=2048654 RepID=UPI000C12581B|nr:hypothetical protein [Solibacillus sp. R5-41]ATP40128.1 hypothetical protein CSE16_08725 [Solibacillus sp. R5-41]
MSNNNKTDFGTHLTQGTSTNTDTDFGTRLSLNNYNSSNTDFGTSSTNFERTDFGTRPVKESTDPTKE